MNHLVPARTHSAPQHPSVSSLTSGVISVDTELITAAVYTGLITSSAGFCKILLSAGTYHLSCPAAGSSDEQTHLYQYQADPRNYSRSVGVHCVPNHFFFFFFYTSSGG